MAVAGLLLAAGVFGQQSSGSLRGIVKDGQGGVVPGARVTLTDIAQGDNREIVTGQDGTFFFNPLKPSMYSVTVEMSGFKKYQEKNIRISANDRLDLPDITMTVGQVSDSITVEAQGVVLQTRGAERGGTLTGNQVINLALNGRSFLDLTRTVPGVVPNGGRGRVGKREPEQSEQPDGGRGDEHRHGFQRRPAGHDEH
jgi:hypothetical protein